MIHWVCHKELKLLQDKVLMEKCWEEHWELHKKGKLGVYKGSGMVLSCGPFEVNWVGNREDADDG